MSVEDVGVPWLGCEMVRWRRGGEPNDGLPSGLGCVLVAPSVLPAVRGRLKTVCTSGSHCGAGAGSAGGGLCGHSLMSAWLWIPRRLWYVLLSSVVDIEG